jgi:hypothetical protein
MGGLRTQAVQDGALRLCACLHDRPGPHYPGIGLRVAGGDVIRAETASGAHRTGRAKLETLRRFLHSGDTLIVAAALDGASAITLYRQLRSLHRPRPVRRAHRGQPRKASAPESGRWCELFTARKLRTTNKKGRHLPTARASMIDDAAIALLAARLRTPLQIEQHLTPAFEHGLRCREKPVTAELPETVLSRELDDLESRLTRHGYSAKNLSDQFYAKAAEVRLFLRGALDAERTRELSEQMRVAGLPL